MVKALDLKSNGIFPRRFEPYSQRYFHHRFPVSCPTRTISIVSYLLSCDGRVVKAFDSKSNGIFPRRFESYSQRLLVSHWVDLENFTKTCALSGNRTPVSRVAGENSTTEPTMLKQSITIHLLGTITPGSNEQCLKCVKWPRWGSNPQSSDSKSDALSIGPRGRWYIVNI